MVDKANARLVIVSLAILTLGCLIGMIAITLAELVVPTPIGQGFTFGLGGFATLATIRPGTTSPTATTVTEVAPAPDTDVEGVPDLRLPTKANQ